MQQRARMAIAAKGADAAQGLPSRAQVGAARGLAEEAPRRGVGRGLRGFADGGASGGLSKAWRILAALRRAPLALILLLAASAALAPEPAAANGGPVREAAPGFGPLTFEPSETIRLVREKVVLELPAGIEAHEEAEVSVEYELQNESEARQSVEMLFVRPGQQSVDVREADGGLLPAQAVDPASLKGMMNSRRNDETIIDPIDGRAFPPPSELLTLAGSRYSLTFAPGETKRLSIRYRDQGGMETISVATAVGANRYYLSPAAYWKGQPEVELEARLPDSWGWRLHSNVPLRCEDGVCRVKLDRLPLEEWTISYASSKRLLFPINRQLFYNLCVLITAAALTLYGGDLARRLRRFWVSLIGSGLGLALVVVYIARLGGYPFEIILLPGLYGLVFLLQALYLKRLARQLKRLPARKPKDEPA
ncbi:hypothetical protein NYE40_02315 [Paenibacillus sp. FSL W8-1187]|uniref:Uncharacterized protein n=1 Tax=Paenibacillus pasadenensis TaxID=217090 RepID=A0A2N5N0V1_9BACL|nr:hypothetical protein [Paenibacillus pasadenensis]PLT43952.1 hypothetical protein B8V81_2383 [Paenibacillus pasadenensis]